MAVGGAAAGVHVPSSTSSLAVERRWGRTMTTTKAVTARRGGAAAAAASIRCGIDGAAAGGTAEEHYRTLRLRPGATRGEVKKAFRRLTLTYHPDVCRQRRDVDADNSCDVDFQRINVAYQMLMSNMREAEERLEYWRLRYGLTDEDLDKYRYYVNDQEQDDEWLDA